MKTGLGSQQVVLLAAAAVGAALLVPSAAADGDPASDYLITQPVFLPFDAHVDKASANELSGLLAAAKKAGFEIRVAVISSKVDLGSVPILYRRPQTYARFLGQELFYRAASMFSIVHAERRRGVPPQRGRCSATDQSPRCVAPGTTAGLARLRRGVELCGCASSVKKSLLSSAPAA